MRYEVSKRHWQIHSKVAGQWKVVGGVFAPTRKLALEHAELMRKPDWGPIRVKQGDPPDGEYRKKLDAAATQLVEGLNRAAIEVKRRRNLESN